MIVVDAVNVAELLDFQSKRSDFLDRLVFNTCDEFEFLVVFFYAFPSSLFLQGSKRIGFGWTFRHENTQGLAQA